MWHTQCYHIKVTRSSRSAESQAADLASHYAEAPDFEQVKSNDEVPEETYFAQCTETIVYGDMVQNALKPMGHDRPNPRHFLKILFTIFKLAPINIWGDPIL